MSRFGKLDAPLWYSVRAARGACSTLGAVVLDGAALARLDATNGAALGACSALGARARRGVALARLDATNGAALGACSALGARARRGAALARLDATNGAALGACSALGARLSRSIAGTFALPQLRARDFEFSRHEIGSISAGSHLLGA